MKYLVSFRLRDIYGEYVGEPVKVARFECAGSANSFAMWSRDNTPGPNPRLSRVWDVTKGKKRLMHYGKVS